MQLPAWFVADTCVQIDTSNGRQNGGANESSACVLAGYRQKLSNPNSLINLTENIWLLWFVAGDMTNPCCSSSASSTEPEWWGK